MVRAVARGDVVFNPGEINFGSVQGGQALTRFIDVEYAGTLNWHITEVVKSVKFERGWPTPEVSGT